MKHITLFITLVAGNLVLGAKWTQKRREVREARVNNASEIPSMLFSVPRMSSSRPLSTIEEPIIGLQRNTAQSNNSFISYTQNWAGALLVNASFTSVTGTIIVPTPTGANTTTQSAGAAWVGIDGGTCTSAILQTGIDWYVQGTTTSYDAWFEWYPQYAYDFSNFKLHAGDSIRLTVNASSTTSGAVKIENLTTGKVVSELLSVSSSSALCETNAEWIVEDFESCDSSGNCALVPFADFGAVDFSNCSATQAGQEVLPGTAGENLLVLDMYQNSQVLTNCVVGAATVNCTYV